MRRYSVDEICEHLGIEGDVIVEFVRQEWVNPLSGSDGHFDDEDLTRMRLILQLTEHLDVNAEAVPIILHLIDQIHHLHQEIQSRRGLE